MEEADGGLGALNKRLEAIDRGHGTAGNRIFYFAIPPSGVARLAAQLGAEGLEPRAGGRVSAGDRGEAFRTQPGHRS